MSLDTTIQVRVPQQLKDKFDKLCDKNNTTSSALLRSLVEAITENRLTVQPRRRTYESKE